MKLETRAVRQDPPIADASLDSVSQTVAMPYQVPDNVEAALRQSLAELEPERRISRRFQSRMDSQAILANIDTFMNIGQLFGVQTSPS
ncbi:MAG TPA: hypothetical protein VFN67_42050 [Polyangiales bacterium]|nr:hypothetical protein [Polyangiales bacterium]